MKTETEIDRVRLHEKRSPPGNQHRRERSRSQRSRRRRRPVPRIRRRSVVRSESRGRPKKIEIPEVQVNHREAVQRGGDREAGPGIEIGGGGGELRLQVRPRAQSSRKKEERARSVKQTQLEETAAGERREVLDMGGGSGPGPALGSATNQRRRRSPRAKSTLSGTRSIGAGGVNNRAGKGNGAQEEAGSRGGGGAGP